MNADIRDWIVARALSGESEIDILTGLCERLDANGLSLVRASLAFDLLDPTYDGRGVRWNRGEGGVEEVFARAADEVINESWIRSPFYALVEAGQTRLRRRLDESYSRGEFPLLDRFADQGATDYVAFATPIDENVRFGEGQGIVSSWLTDAPGGFDEAAIDMLARLLPTLALAFMLHTTHRTARTAITTYLGSDAAVRVLAGNIVRGSATPIVAVVWYSDLIGFTRIADNVNPDALLALLNDYAEAQVEAIEMHGGHVLKFIGDGILAIFPDEDRTRACERALDAATEQSRRIAELNARREADSQPVTGAHLALHLGELLYGNVGSPRRLDFTVLGPAVNEAARIEALCGSLDQMVIVSTAFADAAGQARERLVSLGRYALKGVARPQELFTLDPERLQT
ncbi:MAG TPA: adenylate/guanylate cyclase domain-containing protein [Casimicrobiaceae bacterium]|nr:adenylate/guanylate cyclase domain-containing protein [Casimicrobiaceae bacterium]